ncbi:hypothetical protein CSC13_1481 [Klebsiella pneumoniae]|nr:hypothetical protein CSC25_4324 [Klebsiella pneumoniae]EPS13466.1 hypothetical protein KKPNMP14_09120 [Klebsiella pneumoniae subsp. pneumoniae MP14]CDK61334.1 hypothetical protein [Klebsiella pneumoniae IS10]CDK77729.1 hypothetical protein [Klebsiella pneumoniae IS22]CDL51843.1 hypothetical protein [Klebsiella pneumoniae ISC21]
MLCLKYGNTIPITGGGNCIRNRTRIEEAVTHSADRNCG